MEKKGPTEHSEKQIIRVYRKEKDNIKEWTEMNFTRIKQQNGSYRGQ